MLGCSQSSSWLWSHWNEEDRSICIVIQRFCSVGWGGPEVSRDTLLGAHLDDHRE